MSIELSERAAGQLKSILHGEGKSSALLRFWIAGIGCSGFRYGIGIDENGASDGDEVFESNGVRIVLDQESLSHMKGSRVDYIENGEGSEFSIDNPNPAPESCECGSPDCGEGGGDSGCCGGDA